MAKQAAASSHTAKASTQKWRSPVWGGAKAAQMPSAHVQSGVRWQPQLEPPGGGGDHPVAMGVRLSAVEAQLDAMHKEFCYMKDVFCDLQDRLVTNPPGATAAGTPQDGETGGEGDLFVPSDGTPWGDYLLNDEQMQEVSVAPADQVQAFEEGIPESAHVEEVGIQTEAQLDVAAQKMFRIIYTSRHQFKSNTPITALARLTGVLASEALAALGYSESEIEVWPIDCERGPTGSQGESGEGGGDMEVEEQDALGCDVANGSEVRDEVRDEPDPEAKRGKGYDKQCSAREEPAKTAPTAAADSVMDSATETEDYGGEPPDEQGPGAYVRPLGDDELETIIAMAQRVHEQETAADVWPLALPAAWYTKDPKRAGRCIARAGLGRDPSAQYLSFRTETLRIRVGGELRLQHRSVVHFALWNNEFHGGDEANGGARRERRIPCGVRCISPVDRLASG